MVFGIPRLDLRYPVVDCEATAPLTSDDVDCSFRIVISSIHDHPRAVPLPGKVAFPKEIEFGHETAGGDDVVCPADLGVQSAREKALGAKVREWDQMLFLVFVDVEHCVASVLDVKGPRERHFHPGVAFALVQDQSRSPCEV